MMARDRGDERRDRDPDTVDASPDLDAIGGHPDPDEVDALLDEVLAADTSAAPSVETPDGAAEVTSSLRRVRELSDEPLPTASRSRHLHRIRTHEPHEPAVRRGHADRGVRRAPSRGRGLRRRLVALTAAALALLMLTAGSAVAVAQDADPDDALYGLKRASEQAWLVMPRGSERAAEVHLALADRRIEEARRAPEHAERLVTEGIGNVEAAAEERPEEAIAAFERLLGDGVDSLPEQASFAARAALYRNCVRIADRHGLSSAGCTEPEGEHPGRGLGRGDGEHPGRGLGEGRPDMEHDGPRGWGPGGRPDGEVGPPPGTPGHGRGDAESSEQ